jgi:hypothetical protein
MTAEYISKDSCAPSGVQTLIILRSSCTKNPSGIKTYGHKKASLSNITNLVKINLNKKFSSHTIKPSADVKTTLSAITDFVNIYTCYICVFRLRY